MKNYLERKEKYLNKVKEHPDVIAFLAKNVKNEDDKKQLMIALFPSNEKELTYAELYFDFTCDYISYEEKSKKGEVKLIPLEENEGINMLVEVINNLKNGDYNHKKYPESFNKRAKICYELFNGTTANIFDTYEYILEKCNIDRNDEGEIELLSTYLDMAEDLCFNDLLPFNVKNNVITDEVIENSIIFNREFHRLCEEGKKEIIVSDDAKHLAKLFAYFIQNKNDVNE